ncbi:MAG: hypothetical protein JWL76_1576 [Thermoleophilia bacterium]|nr:hypothetical protein [Thermoleophilia bacterium]
MTWPTRILLLCTACCLLVPATAFGHGAEDKKYRTEIVSIEPSGLPVDVRMSKGDEIRFENQGDEDLMLCGYDADTCEEWVRIGPDGVFVDTNSKAYYSNSEEDQPGAVPEDAGEGPPGFERVREAPAFYAYHDHRVHWMGRALPPGVDDSDPSTQKVMDGEVRFRYGDTPGTVKVRVDYVGGQTWLQRYGEQLIVAGGILVMIVVFAIDAVRRRRRAASPVVADDEV